MIRFAVACFSLLALSIQPTVAEDYQHGPDLCGGHNYPPMIRKSEKKPIRVLLQDGENDLDNQFGNWPLANKQMAKALEFKGYDYKLVFGTGAHDGNHGGAIFPDSLRWLWRGWQEQTP
jgi:enterochelin esterase family protein